MKWNDLTMKERSDLMSLFLKAGVGSLSDMKHIYDSTQDTEEYSGGTLKELNPNKNKVSTKEIFEDLADSYQDEITASLLGAGIGTLGGEIVFGEHTKNKDGGLLHKYSRKEDTYRHNSLQDIVDFTKPSYYPWAGYDNAIEKKDTVQTKNFARGH